MNEPLDLCRIAAETARDNDLLDRIALGLESCGGVGTDVVTDSGMDVGMDVGMDGGDDVDAEMIELLAAWRDDVRSTPSYAPFFGLDTVPGPTSGSTAAPVESPATTIVLDPPHAVAPLDSGLTVRNLASHPAAAIRGAAVCHEGWPSPPSPSPPSFSPQAGSPPRRRRPPRTVHCGRSAA
jgi:hypothetical protein